MSESSPSPRLVARFEIALAILLGLAALSSAAGAYLANSDDGNQLKWLQQSNHTRAQANDAYAAGDQQQALDQTLFIEYITATNDGDKELAAYFTQLSPTLEQALGDWADSKDATPFSGDPPVYEPPEYADGEAYDKQADEEFKKADFYDARGDDFVRATVVLAVALGLLGIAGVLSRWRNKWLFAGLGTAALIGGIVFMGVTL